MRISLCLLLLLAGCREKAVPPAPAAPVPVASVASAAQGEGRARRMPQLPMTAFTWSFAEASDSSAVWTAVADASQRELDACVSDCREIAYEVLLARNHAVRTSERQPPEMDAPAEPMPPEVMASVETLDAYVEMLDPTDDEVAPMKFLAAAAYWRWRDPGAVARLEAVLREHRDDATAEYAANQLLDLLMRDNRFAELRVWVAELRGDETFLADKPDLKETLAELAKTLAALP